MPGPRVSVSLGHGPVRPQRTALRLGAIAATILLGLVHGQRATDHGFHLLVAIMAASAPPSPSAPSSTAPSRTAGLDESAQP